MVLVIKFTIEDVSTLSAVEDLCSSLQMKFTVVRFVGRFTFENNITQLAEVRIVHFVFIVQMLSEQIIIAETFITFIALFNFVFLSLCLVMKLYIVGNVILVRRFLQESNATQLTEVFIL